MEGARRRGEPSCGMVRCHGGRIASLKPLSGSVVLMFKVCVFRLGASQVLCVYLSSRFFGPLRSCTRRDKALFLTLYMCTFSLHDCPRIMLMIMLH
jgi:hypothetical protein